MNDLVPLSTSVTATNIQHIVLSDPGLRLWVATQGRSHWIYGDGGGMAALNMYVAYQMNSINESSVIFGQGGDRASTDVYAIRSKIQADPEVAAYVDKQLSAMGWPALKDLNGVQIHDFMEYMGFTSTSFQTGPNTLENAIIAAYVADIQANSRAADNMTLVKNDESLTVKPPTPLTPDVVNIQPYIDPTGGAPQGGTLTDTATSAVMPAVSPETPTMPAYIWPLVALVALVAVFLMVTKRGERHGL
jgi:hypothetical protein